ncbi:NAD(P)-binding domain-containing protein [Phenylobacterium sp. LjRoot225]|uniref:NAD(P)-dependent oxidoreductase n=1 Tax=Phenylobacterium sp. LjRoot225 TaxID=3342285 RepID=UPI003ED0236E
MTPNPVCGFIGLGSQGAPIARRMIDAGLPVLLWARRPQTLAPFRQTSARIVDSLADLAAGAEHIGLCVIDDAAVLEVCDQLIPAMRPGGRIVIHSTTLPQTCKAVALQARRYGVSVLEAPVSGGAPAAQAGTLTVMTAGDPELLERARPVLQTFSNRIFHLGDHGAAQTAKLVNNSLLAANLALAHQALTAGEGLGLDRASLLELLQASSGRSFGLEVLSRQPSLRGFANAGALADKVRLLSEAAGDATRAVEGLRGAVASMGLRTFDVSGALSPCQRGNCR